MDEDERQDVVDVLLVEAQKLTATQARLLAATCEGSVVDRDEQVAAVRRLIRERS